LRGITVFNPPLECGVLPTISGRRRNRRLGHLALEFLEQLGMRRDRLHFLRLEVREARRMGAHHVVDTHSAEQLQQLAGQLRFHSVDGQRAAGLDGLIFWRWSPKGVCTSWCGARALPIPAFPLIAGERSVGGSPSGAPATVATMLDFCARHQIAPVTEEFHEPGQRSARAPGGRKARYSRRAAERSWVVAGHRHWGVAS